MSKGHELKTIAGTLGAAFLLASCATPEYRQAKSECSADAFRQYPVHLVPTLVTRTIAVQVPSGQTHCVTTQTGAVANTTCQQLMRTDFVPYQESVMVDVNDAQRQAVMNQCAAELCNQRLGNPACKPKSP